jgi:hypothetical protein
MVRLVIAFLLAVTVPATAQSSKAHGPDCSGGWPTNMAQASLKNAGLLNNMEIDFAMTKTTRLASENVGKDLWHQVYLVTFSKRSGEKIQAVVVHDASSQECSMSGVQVYAVKSLAMARDN